MPERLCPICRRPHKHLACHCNHWDMMEALFERIDEMEKVDTLCVEREEEIKIRGIMIEQSCRRIAELEATLEPFADMYDLCYLDEFDDATRCIELHRELIQVLFWKQAKNILGRDMDTNPLRADAASPENGIEEAP